MISLELYTREECRLCELMRKEIESLAGDQVELTETDIDGDPALRAAYWDRVPVLVHEGEVLCFGRLDRERLQAVLSAS